MLIASVSAHERIDGFGHPPVAGYISGFGHHDWLSPGGLVFNPIPVLEHPPLYPAPIVEPPYYPEPAEGDAAILAMTAIPVPKTHARRMAA